MGAQVSNPPVARMDRHRAGWKPALSGTTLMTRIVIASCVALAIPYALMRIPLYPVSRGRVQPASVRLRYVHQRSKRVVEAGAKSVEVLATTVAWLEDELRDAKATIVRQQQSLEQLTGQLWELTTALHRVEDLLATLPPRLEVLPEYDVQIRQVKDDISRVYEHGLGVDSRVNELSRIQQTDVERDRSVLNDLNHRLDDAERTLAGNLPRFDTLDEASRRSLDATTYVRQRLDELERSIDTVESRVGRILEAGGRTEQEFARLTGEIETLHRQDATISERVQIYTEMLKRQEVQISLVSSEVAVKQEVLERIELARLEVHRLEERISVQEAITTELREADDDATRQIGMLDGRDRGLADRLSGLQNDLASYRAVVSEQFNRLHQAQERAKRRQIEEMEREIREMRTHAFRPVDDAS
jgi:DNA repair exonuclease SbcCD ATPase subunit